MHTSFAHMIMICTYVVIYIYVAVCRFCEVHAETKESTRKTEEELDGRNKEGHERQKPK